MQTEDGFAGLLAFIPDNSQTRDFILVNYYASEETIAEYVLAVTQGPEASMREGMHTGLAPGPWISGFSKFAVSQLKNCGHFAFDARDVDQTSSQASVPQSWR